MSVSGKICATPDCGKPAAFKCPTCTKLEAGDTFFHSQECFKGYWKEHNKYHKLIKQMRKKAEESANSTETKWDNSWVEGFEFTSDLRPGKISELLTVPSNIEKPDYALTGIPQSEEEEGPGIKVLNEEEIEGMRKVCKLSREVLDIAAAALDVGVTPDEIDKIVHQACLDRDAYPSPLNYRGFPKSVCISRNEVVCHGIPDDLPFEDGDIVNIDVSLYHGGFHGDLNATYYVGTPSEESIHLVESTRECLKKAIDICGPGQPFRECGNVISRYAKKQKLGVVRAFCGHGVNQIFHANPNVPHYAKNKAPGVMKPGMTFTIEPMINEGDHQVHMWGDGWTATTKGGRSAQFEHTLLVTEDGVEILTGPWDEGPYAEGKGKSEEGKSSSESSSSS